MPQTPGTGIAAAIHGQKHLPSPGASSHHPELASPLANSDCAGTQGLQLTAAAQMVAFQPALCQMWKCCQLTPAAHCVRETISRTLCRWPCAGWGPEPVALQFCRNVHPVLRMMCTPESVKTGWLSCPTSRANAASSMGLCIWRRLQGRQVGNKGGSG